MFFILKRDYLLKKATIFSALFSFNVLILAACGDRKSAPEHRVADQDSISTVSPAPGEIPGLLDVYNLVALRERIAILTPELAKQLRIHELSIFRDLLTADEWNSQIRDAIGNDQRYLLSQNKCRGASLVLGAMFRKYHNIDFRIYSNNHHSFLRINHYFNNTDLLIIDPTIEQFILHPRNPQNPPRVFVGSLEDLRSFLVAKAIQSETLENYTRNATFDFFLNNLIPQTVDNLYELDQHTSLRFWILT